MIPQQGNLRLSGGGSERPPNFTSNHPAFHPDYPLKPALLDAMDEPEFREGGAIQVMEEAVSKSAKSAEAARTIGAVDDSLNEMVNDEYTYAPKAYPPIMSPLNSLKSPPDM